MTQTVQSPALSASQSSWRCVQAHDREGWLALMADDVVIEDPIGKSVTNPEGTGIRVARQGARAPAARTKAERIQIGAGIFADNCQACHQSNVTGRLEAKFTVNGHDFSGVMPSWSLSDEESPRCDFRLHRHFTIDAIV